MLGLGSGINRLSAADASAIAGRIPGFTGLLDESYGSGAAAAYSVRQLSSSENTAMVIRRDSDNQETSIGFDSNGNLDESAIETFCSGTTCKVSEWRDQSGNRNHAVQTTASNQPTIYTGGAIVKENGKPAVQFDGSSSQFDITWTQTASDYSLHAVTQNSATNSFLFDSEVGRLVFDGRGGTRGVYFDGSWKGAMHSGTAQQLQSIYAVSPSSGQSYVNGSQINTGLSYTQTAIGGASTHLGSEKGNSFYINGSIQEWILYASDKSIDRTSIESNIGDYFTQNTPLLDTYTESAVAYSLRKLSSSYSGAAIRVRRANDNLETDINFNVFGELDTVSLAAHCGSNNGYVTIWYDQSSNSNDATQTTAADQPKIYDSVTGVVTRNAKPAIYTDRDSNSSGDKLVTPATTWMDSNLEYACMTVFTPGSGNSGDTWVWDSSGGRTNKAPSIKSVSSVGIQMQAIGTTSAIVVVSAAGQAIRSAYLSSGTLEAFYNGSSAGTATAAGTYNASIERYMGSRWAANEGHYDGYFQEMIWYANDQSANRTNIEDNINTFYSIY
jgi:hypothetical protein